HFGDTDLTGSLSSSLSNLSDLQNLTLTNCRLKGNIPDSIGKLSNLGRLDLSFNAFTGNIPDSVGNLSNLDHLDLSSNQLSGYIPDSFGQLSNLINLELGSNKLVGNIPNSFQKLSNLQQLAVFANELTGGIPNVLSNLPNLQAIFLQGNKLSGPIPDFLSKMQSLDAFSNSLSGPIPDSLSKLQSLGVLVYATFKTSPPLLVNSATSSNSNEIKEPALSNSVSNVKESQHTIHTDAVNSDVLKSSTSFPRVIKKSSTTNASSSTNPISARINEKSALFADAPRENNGSVEGNLVRHFGLPILWNHEQVMEWVRLKSFENDVVKIFEEYRVDGGIVNSFFRDPNVLKDDLGIYRMDTRAEILQSVEMMQLQGATSVPPRDSITWDNNIEVSPPAYE
ncbi:hypothetical protein HDU76_003023, partial [Blyttiomyces sp. JEL0837]